MKKINIYNDIQSRAEISASAYKGLFITNVSNKPIETENANSAENKECQADEATEEAAPQKKKAGRKAKRDIQEV